MTRTRTLPEALTDADVRDLLQGQAGKKPPKFGNAKVHLDGHVFDSKAEALRYTDLQKKVVLGEIAGLCIHEVIELSVYGYRVGVFKPDFTYTDTATGERVVEDVKSKPTMNSEAFRLRAQVFYAVTGMRVRCVNAKGTVLAVLPKPKAPPKPRTPKGAK